MESKAGQRKWAAVYAIAFCACAVGIFLIITTANRGVAAQQSWPTNRGVITSSGTSVLRGENTSSSVSISVKYEYTLNGINYSGQQKWSQNCLSGCDSTSASKKREYSPGNTVVVYYDPDNHHSSRINPESTGKDDWFYLLVIVLGFGGLISFVSMIISIKDNAEYRAFPGLVRRLTEETLAHVNGLGIVARILDDPPITPDGSDHVLGWIEIESGPIRWLRVADRLGLNYWVPDPLMHERFTKVWVDTDEESTAWQIVEDGYAVYLDDHSFDTSQELYLYRDFSAQIAANLSNNPTVQRLFEPEMVGVENDLNSGCWIISTDQILDRSNWAAYQELAEILLKLSSITKG